MTGNKHLDSEYRRRWETYTTPDKTYDSREVNWRDIPWDEVTKLEASVEGHEYVVDNKGDGFKMFIRWRWGGQLAQWDDDGKPIAPKKINVWCIGWTDGVDCFMQEIEFKDGSMKETQYPFEQFKNHLGDRFDKFLK